MRAEARGAELQGASERKVRDPELDVRGKGVQGEGSQNEEQEGSSGILEGRHPSLHLVGWLSSAVEAGF